MLPRTSSSRQACRTNSLVICDSRCLRETRSGLSFQRLRQCQRLHAKCHLLYLKAGPQTVLKRQPLVDGHLHRAVTSFNVCRPGMPAGGSASYMARSAALRIPSMPCLNSSNKAMPVPKIQRYCTVSEVNRDRYFVGSIASQKSGPPLFRYNPR